MGLFLIYPQVAVAPLMWLSLVGGLGLTYWECREQKYERKMVAWWLSLVLLVHVPGYIALRIYVAVQHRKQA